MKVFEGKSPAERNKLIAAIVGGVVALALILNMLFDWTGPASKNQNSNSNSNNRAQANSSPNATRPVNIQSPAQARNEVESLAPLIPVNFSPPSYSAPEAGRNIFAFYVPPPVVLKPPPPATPTPTPPLVLASISPVNVYARTGDFTLEISGDKFTPSSAILVDNSPLPTRFVNAQQLSATVPESMIANDGARQIKVSTPDGVLYSNTMPLMVMAPPVPDYLYIGIIGKPHYNDTAVLKDKSNPKELLNVQRGDLLGGRFRVSSISEREIVLTDTSLRIRHTLPFVEENASQATGTRPNNGRPPINVTESGIPGIPNIPRYQPPGRAEQLQDTEEDEEIPGIPTKPNKP